MLVLLGHRYYLDYIDLLFSGKSWCILFIVSMGISCLCVRLNCSFSSHHECFTPNVFMYILLFRFIRLVLWVNKIKAFPGIFLQGFPMFFLWCCCRSWWIHPITTPVMCGVRFCPKGGNGDAFLLAEIMSWCQESFSLSICPVELPFRSGMRELRCLFESIPVCFPVVESELDWNL